MGDMRETIKKILQDRKMTQFDLATKAGLSSMNLSNIINNVTQDPKFSNILAIARALNISIYDLTGYEDISAEHREFYKALILHVEQSATDRGITLRPAQKTTIINELYDFARQKAANNSNAGLVIDTDYLEWLLRSHDTAQ